MVLAWHTNIAAHWLDLQQWCLPETGGSSFSGPDMGGAFYRTNVKGGMKAMKSSRFWIAAPLLAVYAGAASANDELIKLSKDPNQWVMPTGNYANWRYSELNQINKDKSKTCARFGHSRRVYCAATRAARSLSGTLCTYIPRSPITSSLST